MLQLYCQFCLNPLLLNWCMYRLLMVSKYFLLIFSMFTRKNTAPITSAIWVGNHPYMSIALFRIRVPMLNVNIAKTFRARVIQPIIMMVQFFITFPSLLPNKECPAPICLFNKLYSELLKSIFFHGWPALLNFASFDNYSVSFERLRYNFPSSERDY